MSTYSDGVFSTAAQVGPDVLSVDSETKSKIVLRKMQINASSWTALARGTAGPTVGGTATKLLSETEPRSVGSGVVEWERTYGAIPDSRDEYEDYVFGYQNITVVYVSGAPVGIEIGGSSIVSIPVVVSSRVAYAYFDAAVTAPSAITLLRPFLSVDIGGDPYFFGAFPALSDTEIVAEFSTLRRWRNSDFYERITRYVPRDGLASAIVPP